jgi:hypothetical protein
LATAALLGASAVLALLNLQKTQGLRAELGVSETARERADRQRTTHEQQLKDREAAVAAANATFGETQTKITATEAQLAKVQTEKGDLEGKLRANEAEIAELRKRLDHAETQPVGDASSASSTLDLQAQLEDVKKQLEAAEREKVLLSNKMKVTAEKSTQVETERRHQPAAAANSPGIRGTVLAVNQAYNFVVLSLGARQGVEANSEMLVLRSGSFIGKIRISSVEPATAIGDIISTTLARGVQVQTGDTVVYAGNNP